MEKDQTEIIVLSPKNPTCAIIRYVSFVLSHIAIVKIGKNLNPLKYYRGSQILQRVSIDICPTEGI